METANLAWGSLHPALRCPGFFRAGFRPGQPHQQSFHRQHLWQFDQPGAVIPIRWLQPGNGGMLLPTQDFSNHDGMLGVVNSTGPVQTDTHPFFAAIGANGRGCVPATSLRKA